MDGDSTGSAGNLSQDSYLIMHPTINVNLTEETIQYCYHPTAFDRTQFLMQNGDIDSIVLRPQQPHEKAPKIIWLMSFPNSGTTYTL